MRAFTISVIALTLMSACSGNTDGKEFRDVGPEQSTFVVTPAAPLATPPSRVLPTPTPGGTDRATQ